MTFSASASPIVAEAFILLEQPSPTIFAEDAPYLRDAAALYPGALDGCLASSDWDFASRLADLPETTGLTLDPTFPHAFRLPADCVLIRSVEPRWTNWRSDEDALRADAAGPLRIRYTRRTDQEARLPALFAAAVAAELAARMGPGVLKTSNRVRELEDLAERRLGKAARVLARAASGQRYDGLPVQGDWAGQAVR